MRAPAGEPVKVLIAGGGVTGLEALLALQDLAADRVTVTVVAPSPDFVYKPLSVQAPFSPEGATRFELEPLIAEAGGSFIQSELRGIDVMKRQALLGDEPFDFDTAIVCVGAKPRIVFAHAATLRTSGEPLDIDALIRQAAEHKSKRVAFVLPPMGSWPLPVYELALMTQQRALSLSVDVTLTIVTPEPAPLFVFGRVASDAIATMLESRGIELLTGARASEEGAGSLSLKPGNEQLSVGAVIALPELHGPAVPGLPADQQGFIPIDEHARVQGAVGVYAAGDGTNFPVKHGGLGAQQADAAAEHIAAQAGAPIEPRPFHPVIRGKLITGDETLNLQADIGGGGGGGTSSLDPLWWPPQKIAGKYLSAMLAGDAPHELEPPPDHGIEVEASLDRAWHREPMALDP